MEELDGDVLNHFLGLLDGATLARLARTSRRMQVRSSICYDIIILCPGVSVVPKLNPNPSARTLQ